MKVDIVFPSSSRPEFSAVSLAALAVNTNWDLVRRLIVYTDGEPMREGFVARPPIPVELLEYDREAHGGPVAIMLAYLDRPDAGEVFAKIDNDVIVPPGWIDAAVDVMARRPELDLLGLEPPRSRTPAPWARGKRPATPELDGPPGLHNYCGYALCDAIGGVGLMRSSAFAGRGRMRPHATYGGFTNWQIENPDVTKGWIVPPLSLFLLDRLPFEPWLGLSRQYIAAGHQRPWTNYGPEAAALWEWWIASR
jgi:hypothetical protein